MNIVIAPDKFKGSLTSQEVCDSLAKGLLSVNPAVNITALPMADGGDGFAAILKKYYHCETVECLAADPLGRPMRATFEWDPATQAAVVELAVCSGLVLLSASERNPLHTSTYGTGLVIKAAIDRGATTILLGLGGSATNDAGMGILQALGFRFFGEMQELLEPTGKNLIRVAGIEAPSSLPAVKFIIACDVTNPLFGPNGAAMIYAPQKGADPNEATQLDAGLRNFNEVLIRHTAIDNSKIPGTGAAGGIAAGLMSFFSVDLQQGIEIVAKAAGLEQAMDAADFVLTGEGQLDAQSSAGKVVSFVAARAKAKAIPVAVFAGTIRLVAEELASMHFQIAFAISERASSLEDSMQNADTYLQASAADWFAKIDDQKTNHQAGSSFIRPAM